jgi:hypothetical protein
MSFAEVQKPSRVVSSLFSEMIGKGPDCTSLHRLLGHLPLVVASTKVHVSVVRALGR